MIQAISKNAALWLTTSINQTDTRSDIFLCINRLAQVALMPLRYLCNGKTFNNVADVTKVVYRAEFPEKSWHKTLLAVLLVLPATLIGFVGKLVALCGSEVRRDFALFRNILAIRECNGRLYARYDNIHAQANTFRRYLQDNRAKGRAIWKEEETLRRQDNLMQLSANNMELLFNELAGVANNDADVMAALLTWENKDPGDPLFCVSYFYESFWYLYEPARSLGFYADYDGVRLMFKRPKLTQEDQAPFFTQGSLQNNWNMLQQKLACKLDQYTSNASKKTLRECLRDINENYCIAKDEAPVERGHYSCWNKIPSLLVPQCTKLSGDV